MGCLPADIFRFERALFILPVLLIYNRFYASTHLRIELRPPKAWRFCMAHGFIWWIVIGLIAGWAAGRIMKGGGYGVFADIILGIVGGILGGWIVSLLGFGSGGLIWSILVAILGAVVLIWITRLIKKEV
jgi:uncharacterized membrane protein YeaQ/YmgE (transglycosylase-associated protein family)